MTRQPFTVVGAGMAGLLAAAMLRDKCIAVHERAPTLPNNHSAVLRFRTTEVADALAIDFASVDVVKAIQPWRNPIADALAYSRKTNGSSTLRSITGATGEISRRWIGPDDLIAQMAAAVGDKIRLGSEFNFHATRAGAVISTIPMPALMAALQYPFADEIEFISRPGWNVRARVKGAAAYASLYVPSPSHLPARISLSGDVLIAECYEEPESAYMTCVRAAELLGILPAMLEDVSCVRQQYAKILPINERERRRFIMWASDVHNVFSLGRYATWRPGLLLDDVVNDVRVVQRLASNRESSYSHKAKD